MFKNKSEISIDWLKQNNERLYFFGLGFIQVKINDKYRLHFYSDKLESFVDSPHNHRYDFKSTILQGSITNNIFKKIKGSSYLIMPDSCQKGYVATQPPKESDFELISSKEYIEGQSYKMNHQVFHTVASQNCITLLERGPILKDLADISIKNNEEKLCPFEKVIPESQLWEIINYQLKKMS